MKLCNSEIMKKVKMLEQSKSDLLSIERRNCTITYQAEKDKEKVKTNYSFSETRKAVNDIDNEIRKLRHLLNHSNATTIVEDFKMTLGECLVYMAQLNNEKYVLEELAQKDKIRRTSTMNGVIEYIELTYDINESRKLLDAITEKITKLQIAIDRTNLTNMIEIK